ncbi:MAG: hypothetical protein MPK62_13095, partial [Alphaproteobacteria bacterium]|nr:hypothetical protein [Alphaproteobacteria bacterium]
MSLVFGVDGDDDTADAAPADYVPPSALVLPPAETSVTLNLPITDDVVMEPDEVLFLRYEALPNAIYELPDDPETTITITDNDTTTAKLKVALVDAETQEEVTEPETSQRLRIKAFMFNTDADGDENPVVAGEAVTVTPAAFTGAWGITQTPAAFVIAAGESEAVSRPFPLVNSSARSVTGPAPAFAPDIGSFESANDALESESITLPTPVPVLRVAQAVTVDERKHAPVQVLLDVPAQSRIDGVYDLDGVTASENDFINPDEDLRVFHIPAGARSTVIRVDTIADTDEEDDETLTLTVALAGEERDARVGEPETLTSTITIRNSIGTPPPPTFTPPAAPIVFGFVVSETDRTPVSYTHL